MGAIQPVHLVFVLIIALIVVGPGRIPDLGKALGEGIREFRKATSSGPSGTAADEPIDGAPGQQ